MNADTLPIRALTTEQIDDAEQYSALLKTLDSQLALSDLQFENQSWLTPQAVLRANAGGWKRIALEAKLGKDASSALGSTYDLVVGAQGDGYVAFLAGSTGRGKGSHAVVAIIGRLESARGLGAGQVLLDAFVQIAKDRGCTHIRAELDSNSIGLEHLMQRTTLYGFGPCPKNPGFICKEI